MTMRTIKRYELIAEIGRGGMAVVYKARDTALDRQVALKLLHPHLASRAESRRRFAREAKAVARLRHPNIVEIYDFSGDLETEEKFIVTEYIDGLTLRDFVEDVGVAFPEVGVAITLMVADALAHAHELGIIHRDIKPENVMLRVDGRVKLMDFGIAHVLDADRMTASGSLLGSPAHMPPEIIDGHPGDFRADIFSLGTVLYFTTVNALPFLGNTPTAVLRNIMESRYAPPTLANPSVGRGLEQIIDRCLATEPEGRYENIDQLRDALRTQLESVEIEDAATFAGDYVVDPEGFSARFGPVLVERLLALAEAASEARQIQQAGDLLNRVLAYDPDNAAAIRLLHRLRSGRQARLLALVGLVCIALFGVAWGTMETLRSLEDKRSVAISAEGADEAEVRDPALLTEVGANTGVNAREDLNRLSRQVAVLALERVRVCERAIELAPWVEALQRSGVLGVAMGARYQSTPFVAVIRPVEQRLIRRNGDGKEKMPSAENTTPKEIGKAVLPRILTPVIGRYRVSPDDTWAEVDGARFSAKDGNIDVKLPPGKYDVTFRCPKRCEPTTRTLQLVPPIKLGETEIQGQPQEVIMPWAPGYVTVKPSPGSRNFYLILWPGKSVAEYTVTNERLSVSGFNRNIPRPLIVTVYEMAAGMELGSLEKGVVEARAARTKQVDVGPGERKNVVF